MNRNNIFIYGVPGVGKTYTSKELQKQTGYETIELDFLRKKAQEGKTIETNPFVFLGTTEAYKAFGEPSENNIIKGLIKVREVLFPYIKYYLSNYAENYIAEAAFVSPQYALEKGIPILLVESNLTTHRKQFFANRNNTKEMEISFSVSRIIQKYLKKEAESLNIKIYESDSNPAIEIHRLLI